MCINEVIVQVRSYSAMRIKALCVILMHHCAGKELLGLVHQQGDSLGMKSDGRSL